MLNIDIIMILQVISKRLSIKAVCHGHYTLQKLAQKQIDQIKAGRDEKK